MKQQDQDLRMIKRENIVIEDVLISDDSMKILFYDLSTSENEEGFSLVIDAPFWVPYLRDNISSIDHIDQYSAVVSYVQDSYCPSRNYGHKQISHTTDMDIPDLISHLLDDHSDVLVNMLLKWMDENFLIIKTSNN